MEMLRSTWDWNLFGKRGPQCFGSLIDLTDIDMIVERHGCFLATETKISEAPKDIPKGQRIMFQEMLWTAPITLCVVWGEAESRSVVRFEMWRKGLSLEQPARFMVEPSLDAWIQVYRDWFARADKLPTIEYRGPVWSFDKSPWVTSRIDIENATPLERERLEAQW